jgi:3-carboxy-cis,cis-muconate cycloisomerase
MSSDPPIRPTGHLFGDATVAALLGPRATVQAMLDVEAALADAEASLGIVPDWAVAPIRAAASVEHYDLLALAREAADAGNPAIPLVTHLTREVGRREPRAAGYVHWGATSQDVMDTALVLQLQKAGAAIGVHLDRAAGAAAALARRHIDTVMAGRTLLQQATPVTFGLKAAGWCAAIDRQRDAVARALDGARVLQFGGASGTLASLGDIGLAVADRLAAALGLGAPDLPWHAHRDRLATLGCAFGVACGTCGKVGRDLALLAQTEVGEAVETRERGGGSSTMPHKRNPVSASVALAAAVRAPGLVTTLLAAMPQEHERGLGGWHAEWDTWPDLVTVTAGAARAVADALEGLSVNAARMRTNLAMTRGLVLAEAASMALAEHVGRDTAYQLVERAVAVARRDDIPLGDALAADPEVTRHLDATAIRERLDPAEYLGAARQFVERVLARRRS